MLFTKRISNAHTVFVDLKKTFCAHWYVIKHDRPAFNNGRYMYMCTSTSRLCYSLQRIGDADKSLILAGLSSFEFVHFLHNKYCLLKRKIPGQFSLTSEM